MTGVTLEMVTIAVTMVVLVMIDRTLELVTMLIVISRTSM